MPLINIKENRTDPSFLIIVITLSIFALILAFVSATNLLLALLIVITNFLFIVFLKRPDLAIFLILLAILPGQLLRIPLGGGAGILPTDILVPLFVLLWLIRKIFSREKLASSLLGPLIILFLGIAAISFVNGLRFLNISQVPQTVFYLLRLISYALLFFVALNELNQENRIYAYKKILLAVFFIFAILGIAQIIFAPNLTQLAIEGGWDPHVGRLFSTFLDPNFAGAFLAIGFIFSLSLFLFTKSVEGRIVLAFASALTLIATILTYSRSSYLFLAIAFMVVALLRSRKLLLMGVAILILSALIFPRTVERIQGAAEIDASASQRFQSWSKTLEIARDNPILGVGYNAFRFAQERYYFLKEGALDQTSGGSDSSILTVIVTTGVMGIIAYLIFYLAAIKKSISVYSHSNHSSKRAMGLATAAILIGLIFHSLFVNSLLYPAIMIILFISLGVISAQPSQKA